MKSTEDNSRKFAEIPMETVGPVRIVGPDIDDRVMVPLATLESPLWPSTARGARVSMKCDGIRVVLLDDRMTRSILLEAESAAAAKDAVEEMTKRHDELEQAIASTTKFGQLLDVHYHITGRLLFIRIAMSTGDAAGHNMVTWAADRLVNWCAENVPSLKYVSISGNFCTDKKVSAVNGILGRGKSVVAEIDVPRTICETLLKTTPEALANLHVKKNLIGSVISGGIGTANAHVANMLLAFYLATGQDAANIVEGSQAVTHAEVRGEDLYFAVSLPNLIVGTVGSGKHIPFVEENLTRLGCRRDVPAGENSRRLALICAAAVLCGELSLLAAQTNPGELMRAHRALERRTDA